MVWLRPLCRQHPNKRCVARALCIVWALYRKQPEGRAITENIQFSGHHAWLPLHAEKLSRERGAVFYHL